VQKITLYKHTS